MKKFRGVKLCQPLLKCCLFLLQQTNLATLLDKPTEIQCKPWCIQGLKCFGKFPNEAVFFSASGWFSGEKRCSLFSAHQKIFWSSWVVSSEWQKSTLPLLLEQLTCHTYRQRLNQQLMQQYQSISPPPFCLTPLKHHCPAVSGILLKTKLDPAAF